MKSVVLSAEGSPLSEYCIEEIRYPFSPDDMLAKIDEHAQSHRFPVFRVTVGMPGIVRDGVVIHTPHYIRPAGPGSPVDADLASQWNHCDMKSAIEDATSWPALVVNDALVAAAAVIEGAGSELVLTFGTGLGIAFAVNGRITEHIEISHAPSPLGGTFDDVVGAINDPATDVQEWSLQICAVVDALWPMYRWDRLYIGGGNSMQLSDTARESLTDHGATFLDYEAGARGGVRAWQFIP